ncbi:MAG: class I SAM-dependent methyltransferase [Proteobacteria bacterium]|nr:class I SAM-dependent methyltransferase [Pseudomonadota bacterium]MBU1610822.1 class I SAM-dependent methyltransferase [Pseudomonadota bacterium]
MAASDQDRMREKVNKGPKRNDLFNVVPEGSSRILEIGYGEGTLISRLKLEKNCTELYGIETHDGHFKSMEGLLDGNWNMYIGENGNHLPDQYWDFFNWIIMHDVLEHIYDPWYFLSYVQRYLAPGAKLLLACPNAMYWQTIFSLLHGDFPYGLDGHFNEEHIRWFTPKSMIELAILSGLRVEESHLLLTSKITPELQQFLNQNSEGRLLPMPPKNIGHQGYLNFFPPNLNDLYENADIEVMFKGQGNNAHLAFYAVKIMLVCSVAGDRRELPRVRVGSVKRLRQQMLEEKGEAIAELLPREWKAYVWQSG